MGSGLRKVSNMQTIHFYTCFLTISIRLYYRYEHDRLPACPLTIHALLHIPHYIRRTGPLSGTWSFVMERFCGYLVRPALSNRLRPFDALDNFIRRRAQMQIVALVHNMPQLVKPITHLMLHHGELISTKEKIYEFSKCILFCVIRKCIY